MRKLIKIWEAVKIPIIVICYGICLARSFFLIKDFHIVLSDRKDLLGMSLMFLFFMAFTLIFGIYSAPKKKLLSDYYLGIKLNWLMWEAKGKFVFKLFFLSLLYAYIVALLVILRYVFGNANINEVGINDYYFTYITIYASHNFIQQRWLSYKKYYNSEPSAG